MGHSSPAIPGEQAGPSNTPYWQRPLSPPPSVDPIRTSHRQSGGPAAESPLPLLTPARSSTPLAISPEMTMPPVRSPPTPAPSPGPKSKWTIPAFGAGTGTAMAEAGPSSGSGKRREGESSASSSEDMVVDVFDNAADESMDLGTHPWEEVARAAEISPQDLLRQFQGYSRSQRFAFLHALVDELGLHEALVVSRKIEPRLRRDFLRELPAELALHCLSFVDSPKTLARASQVSRYWYSLMQDETTWKEMCMRNRFPSAASRHALTTAAAQTSPNAGRWTQTINAFGLTIPAGGGSSTSPHIALPRRKSDQAGAGSPGLGPVLTGQMASDGTSFKQQFKNAYQTQSNWLHGGWIVASHAASADGVVTCTALDDKYLVVGMATSGIHVFNAQDGSYIRNLVGHSQGVWTMCLVTPVARKTAAQVDATTKGTAPGPSRRASASGATANGASGSTNAGPSRPTSTQGFPGSKKARPAKREKLSDSCGAAEGWGVMRPILVSGGCDKRVKVWDILSGTCVHTLAGHTSTIRCIKVLDGRPIAVSGSRDGSLRVWDIHKGKCLRTLLGHDQSVRCIEIAGNRVVSGSYDNTARVWDVDTGECLHVLRGHYHQIYAIGFDGLRVVTGSLDSTIRVWSAATGDCVALLQGHTSLIGQLHLHGDRLISGGSDGRVICHDLNTYECLYRSCAHDNSVTSVQMDDRWLVSGGNDGRVKLWDATTGAFIRELTKPCDAIWKASFKDDRVFMLCQRGGRSVLEMITFKPGERGLVKLKIGM